MGVPANNMRYRLASDDDGHDCIIPSDKSKDWEEYLKLIYSGQDVAQPEWVSEINQAHCITFTDWKED